jgi:hypothetical protein
LADAVYFLYDHNRVAEAARWYRYLGQQFPNDTIIYGDANSYPRNLTLDEYAVARVQGDINDTDQPRTTSNILGLLTRAYIALALGEDDRYNGLKLLARRIYDHYQSQISGTPGSVIRTGLMSFPELDRIVLNQLLDPQQDLLPYAARAVIRSQLRMPAETSVPSTAATNTVETVSTNSVAK